MTCPVPEGCRTRETADGRCRGSSRRWRDPPEFRGPAVSRQTAFPQAKPLPSKRLSGVRFNMFSMPPSLAWAIPVPPPRRRDGPTLGQNAGDEFVERNGVCETAGAMDGCAYRADDALFDVRAKSARRCRRLGGASADRKIAFEAQGSLLPFPMLRQLVVSGAAPGRSCGRPDASALGRRMVGPPGVVDVLDRVATQFPASGACARAALRGSTCPSARQSGIGSGLWPWVNLHVVDRRRLIA